MGSASRFFVKLCLMLWRSGVHSVRHNLPKTLFDIFVPVAFFLLTTISRAEYQKEEAEAKFAKPYFEESFFTPPYGPRLSRAVAFSPNNTLFTRFLDHNREIYDEDAITFIGVDTAENLEALLMQNRTIIAGIQFNHPDNITEIPDNFNFSLRFPAMMRWYDEPWPTDILYKEQMSYRFPRKKTQDWDFYRKEGFLTLQYRIMNDLHLTDYANRTLYITDFPAEQFPDYPENLNFDKFQFLFPPLVLIAFHYTYLNTICCIVVERRKQTKEMMRLMGISNWIYWLSSCLQKMLLQIVTVTIIVALMKTRLGYSKAVFENSDFLLLWLFFVVYCTCFTSLGLLLSVFFTDLKIAMSLSTVIWFASFLPFTVTHVGYKMVPDYLKMALYISPNTAMGYGIKLIFQLELMMDNGLDRSTLWNGLFPYDILSVGTIMYIMLCTSMAFLGILMYIVPIFPGSYGVASPAYYLFTKDFWSNRRSSGKKYSRSERGENDEDFANFENEPENRTPGIQVKNLTKTFVKGKPTIIRNLSLNIYKNEITVLCGPNASGKTTLMLILSGMLSATSGTALIDGYNIQKRTNLARKSMGFCPQQNILLDGLTAREHILFYSLVKGSNRKTAFADMKRYSKLLDFVKELNITTSKLSSGTQRKLSIALAFCGRPKFVLLDHPSHSLDPAARRLFWKVLINEKKERVILITTHLTEEVETIADRIAFITDGELKCWGSTTFVRKRFGVYRLVCTKDDDCKSNATTRLLDQYFPGIAIETESKTHLSYLLSYHKVHKFGRLFEKLETFYVSHLKLKSFRISIATTEFLLNEFVKEPDELSIESLEIDNYSDDSDSAKCPCRVMLIPSQVTAILMKRFLCGIRKWRSFILHHLIVIILMIPLAYDLNLRTLRGPNPPPLEISLDSYENSDYCFLETMQNYSDSLRDRIRQNISEGYRAMFGPNPNSLMLLNITDMDTYAQKFGVQKYRYNFLIGISLTGKKRVFYANTFSAIHALPISLKYYLSSRIFPVRNATVINAPLNGNTTIGRATSEFVNMEAFGIDFPIFVGILVAIMSSAHIMHYIKEKRNGTKMKQFVNGVNCYIFWLTSIVWDSAVSVATTLAIVLWLYISERAYWSEINVLYIVASILFMFNLTMLPINGLFSLIFSNPATGANALCGINTFLCMMIFVNNYGVQFIPEPLIKQSLSAIPVCALIECLMKLTTIGKRCQSQCEEICDIENREKLCEEYPACCPPFTFLSIDDGIRRELLFMASTGLIALLLLLAVEHEISKQLLSYGWNFLFRPLSFMKRRQGGSKSDDSQHSASEDSIGDEQQMESCFCPVKSEKNDEKMSVLKVSKYYGRRLAVDEISLTLKRGECVGLIAKNGMGKSTIFKMLTGEHRICYGTAALFGLNLKWNTRRTHDFVGYCPQSDRLWNDLTVCETLRFFCLLRGTLFDQATDLAKNLNLSQQFARKVSQLSGGNKQILSVIVALIGDPSVIFLDEATTCIDDSTKRALWTILSKLCDSGKSILISSDNMLEYQTVCTRFIVAEGDDSSLVESKPVFIELLIESNMADYKINNSGIVELMKRSFKQAQLRSTVDNLLTFDIPFSPVVLSKVFMVFEKRKRQLCIENYYVWVK